MQWRSRVLRDNLEEINTEQSPEPLVVSRAEPEVFLQTAIDAGIGKIIDRNTIRDTVPESGQDAFFGRHGGR
jgi:hypothetical protein